MGAVFKREFRAFFTSPVGYVVLAALGFFAGLFFYAANILGLSSDLSPVFSSMFTFILMILPLVTMRLLSDEKRQKTDQALLTSPVSLTGIVLGKYFAALAVYLITLGITLIYLIVLAIHGEPAYAQILCNYFGFALLGAAFISIGIFISSLTENQATSAVSTFAVLLLLFIIDWVGGAVSNAFFVRVIDFISITKRFQDFQMGVLNVAPIVYYVSFVAMFLILTATVLERRRVN